MASVSFLAMLVPRPVPPYPRLSVVSACSKALKSRLWAASGMPMPVSVTVNFRRTRRSPLSSCTTSSRTDPVRVNLTALATRLVSTWRRWSLSPRMRPGTSGATRDSYDRPFARAVGRSIRSTSAITSHRTNSSWESLSLPASMAEMSSTSSTSDSRLWVDARMVARYSRCSLSRRVVASSSATPARPLSGVRNSWLMLARKRLLASFARSASWVARVSARSSPDRYSGTATSPTSSPMPRLRLACQ